MAQTEEQSPPRTIRVAGAGTNSLSYTLPDAVALDIESVYVDIAASIAGDATATLVVQDQSGVVIARKAQTNTIPASGTGSATWALRLDDEAARATTAASIGAQIIRGGTAPAATVASGNLVVTTTFMQHDIAVYANGITADVASTPSRLTILTDGLYLVNVGAVWAEAGAADYGYGIGYGGVGTPIQSPLQTGRRVPSQVNIQETTIIQGFTAGTKITQVLGQNSGVAKTMPIGFLTAYRLGPVI